MSSKKNLLHLVISLLLCWKTLAIQGQLDPESNVYSFPVNKTVYQAFGITDLTTGQLVDFKVDGMGELNDSRIIWFWLYVFEPTPPVDFIAESGLVGISAYGPFSKEYLQAADSVEFGLVDPVYSDLRSALEPADQLGIPSFSDSGLYLIGVNPYKKSTGIAIIPQAELLGRVRPEEVRSPPRPCISCLNGKLPLPGKYLFSAWTSVVNPPAGTTSFTGPNASVRLYYPNNVVVPFAASVVGNVIDGWQLMETEFEITQNLMGFEIRLLCNSGSCLYDDIRFLPFDGSMKSYVYDAENLRLLAELDERHYATLYEYDEEGKLRRIKKETERGIMTIQESSSATSK